MDNEKTYESISETLSSNDTDIYSTVIKNEDNIYTVAGAGTHAITSSPPIDVLKTTAGTPSYEVPKIVKVKKYRLYKEGTKNGNSM